MAKRYKVRFNLGKGPNYMKWKIESPNGDVNYYDPQEYQLLMQYCKLKNSRKTATKIFLGEHKTVCAWILCQNLAVRTGRGFIRDQSHRLRYNPKEAPYWQDEEGRNVDGKECDHLHTIDSRIYVGH